MKASDKVDELSKALLKFQEKVSPVKKNATADVMKAGVKQYDYQYATLDAIWEDIKPTLKECNLVVVQGGNGVAEGRILLATRVIHTESGQWIESELPISSNANSPQDDGKATTYGRRYGLSAILSLMTELDDDANPANAKPSYKNDGPAVEWVKKPVPVVEGGRVMCPKCDVEVAKHFKSGKGNWTTICGSCSYGYAHPKDIKEYDEDGRKRNG